MMRGTTIVRHPVDNCLSISFQQLGGNLSYAADIQHTAHYYHSWRISPPRSTVADSPCNGGEISVYRVFDRARRTR